MDALMQAKIKAFDEFTAVFQRYERGLQGVDRAQKQTRDSAKDTDKAMSAFLQTVGNIGGLYALQRGLMAVMGTGRQFELTIKQAQAVTGDFSSTLRDLSMTSSGSKLDIHTPTELAEAYRELGQAGANTNDIMQATPDILEFGVAALLNTEKASYGVMAAVKSFNMQMSQTSQVVDAYTEAMNRGALAGEDFQWVMSSAGAVAKMAKQDFREILSVASAMRDSGIQAQDAGTSIKAALMMLMNPSEEAKRAIKDLGIEVYDASGQMKQWSDIVAEFEKVLAPYNDQAQQMILGTIFGTDGIRAMATSLNKGSGYLRTFTEGLKNADGATRAMAEAMSETFDGAIRRTNASLERAKVLMFEDFAKAAVPMLEVINTILIGFNNLDTGARRYLEVLIGAGGLVFAIGAVANAMRALGITITLTTGVVGIGIAAMGALVAALLYANGEATTMIQTNLDGAAAKQAEIDKIQGLVKEYEDLTAITKPTADEQDRLRQVTDDLTSILPGAITGFDNTGNALTDLKTVTGQAADEMNRLRIEMKAQAELAGAIAQAKLPQLKDKYEMLQIESQVAAGVLQGKNPEDMRYLLGNRFTRGEHLFAEWGWIDDKELALKKANEILEEYKTVSGEYLAAQQAVAAAEAAAAGGRIPGSGTTTSGKTPGTKSWTPPKPGGKDPAKEASKKAAEAARNYVEMVQASLYPYQAATEAAANAVAGLSAKEQHLAQVMQSGQGTIYQAVELNKTRTEQMRSMAIQQQRLKDLADAERIALANVAIALKSATNPDAVKALRQEMMSLTGSIAQAGQEWWRLENEKFRLQQAFKQEEKQRWDDAYQEAMDLMRHEVNMARMSTSQQIEYIRRLRDAHKWNAQQMREIDESLFRLYRQELSKYLDGLDDEYKKKLKKLESDTEATIANLQAQIDALDKQGESSEREEALRQHNERLTKLQEDRRYHELRTGEEHRKAIADIDQQIADEQRSWEQQQAEWTREDQKENLEDQIDQVRDAHEQERQDLEDHYNKAREIAEDGILDIIAALAATGPEWMNTGKQLIDQLITGLESGDFSRVQDQINQIGGTSGSGSVGPTLPGGGQDSPLFTISSGQYRMIGNSAAMWSQELGNLLGVPVSWNQSTGLVTIGGKTFKPLETKDGKSWVGIRAVAEALGYGAGWDQGSKTVSIYRSYAKGGPIWGDGPAMVHDGEYMIPAGLVDAIRRGAPAPTSPGWSTSGGGQIVRAIDEAADRIVAAIESKLGGISIDKLLNIENFEGSDEVDVEILSKGLRSQVLALAGARVR